MCYDDYEAYPINNPTRFGTLVGVDNDAGPENDGFAGRLFLSPPLLVLLNLKIPDILMPASKIHTLLKVNQLIFF